MRRMMSNLVTTVRLWWRSVVNPRTIQTILRRSRVIPTGTLSRKRNYLMVSVEEGGIAILPDARHHKRQCKWRISEQSSGGGGKLAALIISQLIS